LRRIAEEFKRIDLTKLEKILPFCVPPWRGGGHGVIQDREEAMRVANTAKPKEIRWYTDASEKDGFVGAAVVGQFATGINYTDAKTLGTSNDINAYYAELTAILMALRLVKRCIEVIPRDLWSGFSNIIFTDCQSAIKSISRPRQQSAQNVICDIIKSIDEIEARTGMATTIRWVPAHCKVLANEMANRAARETTSRTSRATQRCRRLKSAAWKWGKQLLNPTEQFHKSDGGRYTKRIDKALPGKHVYHLYDNLTREDAALLSQLRTGKCRLNSYLSKIGAVPSPNCDSCGVPETVEHYLLHCRRWSIQRTLLIQAAGDRMGDLSYLLGGWSEAKSRNGDYLDGPRTRWKPDLQVVAATLAFAKATRRLARTNDA
jgi:ribonuclease HI